MIAYILYIILSLLGIAAAVISGIAAYEKRWGKACYFLILSQIFTVVGVLIKHFGL